MSRSLKKGPWIEPYLMKKVQEMHGKVVDMAPCPKCEALMKQGIILLTFDPELSDKGWEKEAMPNPYRTGGFFVVTEDACKNLFNEKMFAYVQQRRWVFIEHEIAEEIGLFDIKGKIEEELEQCKSE